MKNETTPVNRLILGDNLEIMKTLESESVDLIYLDPPFFSNRNYEIIWGDAGEIRSFKDRWSGGIDHYIMWLKERVEQMHRILKKTGSIFLHCDWHAQAYIRVDILDKIFGISNYVNEIVWCYTAPANVKNRFPQKHDTIYFYSKSKNYHFSADGIKIPYNQSTIDRTSHSVGKVHFKYKGDAEERHKNRLDVDGKVPEDWWTDISRVQGNAAERIGYPTQKPEALLERIIKCASNEDDVILDPFIGGGTTAAVADRLHRRWIGIDQSTMAIKVTELRLDKQSNMYSAPFSVQLQMHDYNTIRYSDAFEFQNWIIQQFGGTSSTKPGGDLGLDGKMSDNTPIQVKRSDNIGRNVIDNFLSAIKRVDKKLYDKNIKEKKPVGYIIAFSFGKGAIAEVARLKLKEKIIIELVTVDSIVPIADGPSVTIRMRELDRDARGNCVIEFSAKGRSKSEISFYTWDFNYDEEKGFVPFTLVDKEGKQTHQFKAGVHTIAVKVVDDEGLESIETIKLKVNGVVKKLQKPM